MNPTSFIPVLSSKDTGGNLDQKEDPTEWFNGLKLVAKDDGFVRLGSKCLNVAEEFCRIVADCIFSDLPY